MNSPAWLKASPVAALFLCVAFAGLPGCAQAEEVVEDDSSAAAQTQEEAEGSEDVASLAADGADRRIAKAVFGVSKLKDEKGKKRVFAHVRYYDKDGKMIAYGVPQAKGDTTEFVLVRMEGTVKPADANGAEEWREEEWRDEEAQLAEEARALTERLVKDVEANGCSVGKGALRAVGRFIGGLVALPIGFVVALALSPVYLVILISEGGDVESKFVDVTTKPYMVGLQLIKGAFKPCRALEPIEE